MTRRPLVVAAALLLAAAPLAHAALITGPWSNATGQGNGPITGADTASPVVGDGSANSADGEMIHAPFPAVTLANSGDKVVLTASVTLAGTVNSAASTGAPRTQFRFGLFDGDADDLGWPGYLLTNTHGNGTPNGGIIRKNAGNTNVYLSTTGTGNATTLASSPGDGSVFNDDTYALSMTIERSGNDLLISASLTGTATTNFSQVHSSVLDANASTLGTYTFDRVGFLLGSNLDTDQATFSNVDVTFTPVPEPASAATLAALSLLTLPRRRTHR